MVDLLAARSQMAMSLGFHMIFATFGIGLPALLVVAEALFLRTWDRGWRELAERWAKGTVILFAVGAVSGTVLSFELGLLWPGFMAFAGPPSSACPSRSRASPSFSRRSSGSTCTAPTGSVTARASSPAWGSRCPAPCPAPSSCGVRARWRSRSFAFGAVFLLAWAAFFLARTGAPLLWAGLWASAWAWPFQAAVAVIGAGTLGALATRWYQTARALAAAQAILVGSGWALSLWPYTLPPDLTVYHAAPDGVIRATLTVLALGAPPLLLAYGWLLHVFGKDALPGA